MTYRFEFDPTGVNPDNKIENEVHNFTHPSHRLFIPAEGVFYTNDLVVKDQSGNTLQALTDYVAVVLHEVTYQVGLEACCGLLIKNQAASSVSITYQAVGGEYGNVQTELQDLIDNTSPEIFSQVYWGQVVGKPVSFPPALHQHPLGDITNWAPVLDALDQILKSIQHTNESMILNVLNSRLNAFTNELRDVFVEKT